jgi:hypothetical protein
VLALFVFTITSIILYLTFRSHAHGEPEHDLVKATKEYNDYLSSPEHRALIYPMEADRAHGQAAIIALVRNSELREMSQSMRELEETFNRKFKYRWIFFNDEPFDDKFKRITTSLTDAETQYGTRYPKTGLMNRGYTKGALECTELDPPRYDAGIVRQIGF